MVHVTAAIHACLPADTRSTIHSLRLKGDASHFAPGGGLENAALRCAEGALAVKSGLEFPSMDSNELYLSRFERVLVPGASCGRCELWGDPQTLSVHLERAPSRSYA